MRTMKQELCRADSKPSSPAPPVRNRVSMTKDSPAVKCSANGISSPESKKRAKPASLEAANANGVRRPILLNRLKTTAADDGEALKERGHDDPKAVCLPKNRAVEQYARLQRRPDAEARKLEKESRHAKAEELENRVDESEKLTAELREEVMALKGQLQKLESRNVELELQNRKLVGDLSAAEAKIRAFEGHHQIISSEQQVQRSATVDVKKLVGNDVRNIAKEVHEEDRSSMSSSLAVKPNVKPFEVRPQIQRPSATGHAIVRPLPPPPPPPPLSRHVGRTNAADKGYSLVELYRSLTRRDGKDTMGNGAGALNNNKHNSIVGELQNRSTHLLAIKADVASKRDLIKHLINKVQSASFTDMEDVLAFVDWLDGELSKLVDETAVLKHFSWPEKKVDAMREAAFEYRSLKMLEVEVSSFGCDASVPCEATLRKITHLLDKLERSTQRLMKLRNPAMALYKECKLPTDWMLDSGIVSKMKMAPAKLAKLYIKRISMELESARRCKRESAQEALLLQGVHFAYRAHQFAGGLDFETMVAVEELKKQVHSQIEEPKN